MGKRTKRTVIPNAVGKKVIDQHGEERIVVIEEAKFYTFKNVRKGATFFKREDGKEDLFEGDEEKDDITETEARMLRKSPIFKNGWIIEVTEDNVPEEANSFSDEFLGDFINKNKAKTEKIREFIETLTSELSISRVKEALINNDLPVSLALFCDYKIGKIQEEQDKEKEIPEVSLENNAKIIIGDE